MRLAAQRKRRGILVVNYKNRNKRQMNLDYTDLGLGSGESKALTSRGKI